MKIASRNETVVSKPTMPAAHFDVTIIAVSFLKGNKI
jgi:hypothetical protein